MERLIIFLLCVISMTKAYLEPKIQVYEIRKTQGNRDVDTHYFDPDGLRKEDLFEKFSKINKKINIKSLNKLMNLLMKGEKEFRGREESLENNTDLTGNVPVIIISLGANEKPQRATAFEKLLRSPLRSQYYDGIEDRTAPPRIRRPYDDDEY